MPNRRIIELGTVFILILACNLPRPEAGRTPQTVDPASSGRTLPAASETISVPRPTPTAMRTTEKPTLEFAGATVDDFFNRCPTAEEIADLRKIIGISVEDDPTAGTAACKASEGSLDLSPLQKRAYQSVLIIKNLSFDAPLPWTEKDLFHWFTATIQAIRFRADIPYSYCCEPAHTINIRVADNSYLMLTGRWIDPALGGGLMDTMVLFVHEARHDEGYGHTCTGNQDDKTIAEMGAWGVQYYLLQWLAQHGDPVFFRAPGADPDLYRRIALEHMISIRKSRFCGEPTVTPGATPTLAG